MKKNIYFFFILLALGIALYPRYAEAREKSTLQGLRKAPRTKLDTIPGKRLDWGRRTDGYLVYDQDTLHGYIMLYKKEVLVEQPVDADYSYFYQFRLKDTLVKTILMYNEEKRPIRLARAHDKNNRLLRVVHEGKLNIYDGRIGFVYRPRDVDKFLLVVSYDGIVDDLSSFLSETTKSDLIMYVNDIYGLKLVPRKITWRDLLLTIDQLD